MLVSVTEDMTGHEGLQCAFGLRDIRCSASIAMLAKPMSMKYLLARSGKQRAGSKYLDIVISTVHEAVSTLLVSNLQPVL